MIIRERERYGGYFFGIKKSMRSLINTFLSPTLFAQSDQSLFPMQLAVESLIRVSARLVFMLNGLIF